MSELAKIEIFNLHRKAEKIASATFLVANLMPEKEVLKDKIKDLSLKLVSSGVHFSRSDEYPNFAFKELEKHASELLSFLNIAFVSGFISEMNVSILKAEFEIFLKILSEIGQTNLIKKTYLSRDFFEDSLKKDIRPFSPVKELSNIKHEGNFDKKDSSGRKEQRSKAILDFLSKKGDVNIKDISSSIRGCSEKTIQREINNMIHSGLIKRIGDRRWSRYSLA